MHTKMGINWLACTVVGKDLGFIMHNKLNMNQCDAFAKTNVILGYTNRRVVFKSREVIVPLYLSLLRPQLESCVQYLAQHFLRNM